MSHRSCVASILIVAAPLIVVGARVAEAQIHQPGTQPTGEPGGMVTPIQTANTCVRCHGLYDLADDYEPYDSWRGSMMANASRDPVYLAALAIAEEDHPDAADFCVRCHSPSGWLGGRSSLPEWSMAEGPRLSPDEEGFPSTDLDGVTCMVCHRIDGGRPPGSEEPALANAQIYFVDEPDGELRLGPYDYRPGTEPTHPVERATFLAQSELCGSCHDIYNPVLNERLPDGTDTGRPFNVERTYSEWLSSAFATRGQTCQDCHMVELETDVRASDDGPLRDYFRRHDLVGGNYWVPRAIATRVLDSSGDHQAALEATADAARDMLQTAAEVEITDSSYDAGTATATVRVTNLTGHKLPTGYPEGRRMWLEAALVDETGAVVGGSGLFDESTGDLRDAADAQLRSYEIKLGEGAEPSFHFVINDTTLLDTRIPPEGFAPDAALGLEPKGRDYSDGKGGFNHWDEASYLLPVTCGTGTVTLRVRLLYQATTREYIEFLRDNAPDSLDPMITNWGTIAYDLWQTQGGMEAPTMAEATVELGAAPMPCPGPDAGMADAGGIDAGGTPDSGAVDAGPVGDDDDGCGCSVPGRPATPGGALVAALFLALTVLRRRR